MGKWVDQAVASARVGQAINGLRIYFDRSVEDPGESQLDYKRELRRVISDFQKEGDLVKEILTSLIVESSQRLITRHLALQVFLELDFTEGQLSQVLDKALESLRHEVGVIEAQGSEAIQAEPLPWHPLERGGFQSPEELTQSNEGLFATMVLYEVSSRKINTPLVQRFYQQVEKEVLKVPQIHHPSGEQMFQRIRNSILASGIPLASLGDWNALLLEASSPYPVRFLDTTKAFAEWIDARLDERLAENYPSPHYEYATLAPSMKRALELVEEYLTEALSRHAQYETLFWNDDMGTYAGLLLLWNELPESHPLHPQQAFQQLAATDGSLNPVQRLFFRNAVQTALIGRFKVRRLSDAKQIFLRLYQKLYQVASNLPAHSPSTERESPTEHSDLVYLFQIFPRGLFTTEELLPILQSVQNPHFHDRLRNVLRGP